MFRGRFPVINEGHEIDGYLVEIVFPEGIAKPPLIREIGGRIPQTMDRHVYSSGYLCIEVPELTLIRGYEFITYLDGPVRNYFIGQSLVERGESWPFGVWEHRKVGLLQAYSSVLKVSGEPEIRRYLDCLSHKKIKGHWTCPCGTGKPIRDCHAATIRSLQKSILPKIAKQALIRLDKNS
jgi:hypothetical protein